MSPRDPYLKFNKDHLEDWLRTTLNSTSSLVGSVHPRDLTIGLEQEFFLYGPSGDPATHSEGQSFLEALSNQAGWYIRETSDGSLGRMIERVSIDLPLNRYTTIKYDHHPHLFEIAFAYTRTLSEQSQQVHEVFSLIQEISKKLGLIVGDTSTLNLSPLDPKIASPLKTYEDLRNYRSKLLCQGTTPINLEHSNYAAVIAATQTHIGGTQWWNRTHFMETLYSFETDVLPILQKSPPNQRWRGYLAVFSGYPLVGFPEMNEWSIGSWAKALLESPLLGPTNSGWAGRTIHNLNNFPFKDSTSPWSTFMKSVRDLQIIRPKLFGTLEFRADPAQCYPEDILFVAALRLGLCAAILNSSLVKNQTFSDSAKKWRETVKRTTLIPNNTENTGNILKLAMNGLIQRGLGEERYLLRSETDLTTLRSLA